LLVFIETRRWPHPERLYVGAPVGDISIHRANSPTINVLSRACSWPVGATNSLSKFQDFAPAEPAIVM
jgi:hypothetical protein